MPRPRPWFIALIALLGLLLLSLAGFVKPIREGLIWVFLPAVRATANAGESLGRFFRLDADAATANERVEELEARLQTQTVDYVRLRALEEENRLLRSQANFVSETGYRTVGARVISRSITFQTAVVSIDRGTNDGVEVGQAVVTEEGIYVGKVTAIGERTSSVRLLTDLRSRTAAKVSGGEHVSGVVEGRGSGVAHFTLIPQGVELAPDDVIVTAGTEEKIPANLAIGLVNDIESQATDPFKNAAIEPLAPLDRLELVSVIITGS